VWTPAIAIDDRVATTSRPASRSVALLFVLLILADERRRVVHVGVTDHPTGAWTAQRLRETFPWNEARTVSAS